LKKSPIVKTNIEDQLEPTLSKIDITDENIENIKQQMISKINELLDYQEWVFEGENILIDYQPIPYNSQFHKIKKNINQQCLLGIIHYFYNQLQKSYHYSKSSISYLLQMETIIPFTNFSSRTNK
jgi:hypothetical protein